MQSPTASDGLFLVLFSRKQFGSFLEETARGSNYTRAAAEHPGVRPRPNVTAGNTETPFLLTQLSLRQPYQWADCERNTLETLSSTSWHRRARRPLAAQALHITWPELYFVPI